MLPLEAVIIPQAVASGDGMLSLTLTENILHRYQNYEGDIMICLLDWAPHFLLSWCDQSVYYNIRLFTL